jgi:hypothetical protein
MKKMKNPSVKKKTKKSEKIEQMGDVPKVHWAMF